MDLTNRRRHDSLPHEFAMDGNARVSVRVNDGGTTYTRRRLNLIGSGVTITIGDDSGDEEIDITITASGGTLLPTTYTGPAAQDALSIGDGSDVTTVITTDDGVRFDSPSGTAVWISNPTGQGIEIGFSNNGDHAPAGAKIVELLNSGFQAGDTTNGYVFLDRGDGAGGQLSVRSAAGALLPIAICLTAATPNITGIDLDFKPAVAMWVDEAANKLKFQVVYTDGTTVKNGEIALT